ncbi:leucine-rich repeat protein [Butyrivibrio sp. VCD2006]|uniref:leucine-rich repeat protein n=1 Tax=Butyrivibrio sp. VCD2006 TaxID=1280664 RepID=UPI000417FB44|nr:leucine-rich repeat protein [Butyrivibrio sp. VCD2006]
MKKSFFTLKNVLFIFSSLCLFNACLINSHAEDNETSYIGTNVNDEQGIGQTMYPIKGECGKSGDNLQWKLEENGTLTIFGQGEMAGYVYTSDSPWDEYRDFIKEVKIEEGVTSISQAICKNYLNLERVYLPDTLTVVSNNTFQNCPKIEELVLPKNVTDWGYAFSDCKNIKKITITANHSLERLNFSASKYIKTAGAIGGGYDLEFASDGKISYITGLGAPIENVVYPEGVEEIYKLAFEYSKTLKSVEFPRSLKYIDTCAFYKCNELSEVIFYSTQITMGANALNFCPKLRTVGPADGDYDIKIAEVSDVFSLTLFDITDLYIPDGVKVLSYYGPGRYKQTYSIGEYSEYLGHYTLNSVRLPESLEEINCSFYKSTIKEITIPSSVTSISSGAFEDCDSLCKIYGMEGLTEIEDELFNSCDNLEEIVLSDNITSIGEKAFYGCKNLKSITLPTSLQIINNQAFAYCDNLEKIVFSDNITSIGVMAFYECKRLQSITLPTSLQIINNQAFAYCDNLEKIVFSDNITSIGEKAFYECKKLQSITLPSNLQVVKNGAFVNCDSLSYLEFKGELTTLEEGAFHYKSGYGVDESNYINLDLCTNCKKLKDYDWNEHQININHFSCDWYDNFEFIQTDTEILLTRYIGPNSDLTIGSFEYFEGKKKKICLSGAVFEGNESIESVNINNEVTIKDGTSMFDGCISLKSVVLPNNMTIIDNYMFNGCSNLKTVSISEKVTDIGDYAFYNCSALDMNQFPTEIKSIGNVAFYNCNKLSVERFPNSLLKIGKWAFYNCYLIKDIAYDGTGLSTIGEKAFYSSRNINTSLASKNEALLNYDWEDSNRALKHLVSKWIEEYEYSIDDSSEIITLSKYLGTDNHLKVPSIAYHNYKEYKVCLNNIAFSKNVIIKTVSIESGVIINNTDGLFNGCTNLEEVEILTDYVTIGDNMFKNCSNLKAFSMNNLVINIGENAFCGCSKLEEILLSSKTIDIGARAFYGCSNLKKLSLPSGISEIKEETFSGCSKLSINMLPKSLKKIGAKAFFECGTINAIGYTGSDLTKIGEKAFYISDKTETLLFSDNYALQSYDWNTDNRVIKEELTTWYSEFNYEIKQSNIKLKKYIGTDDKVIIYPYAFIGNSCYNVVIQGSIFKENDVITSVTIMDGVNFMEEVSYTSRGSAVYQDGYEFYKCENLKEVVLPTGLKKIGQCSFAFCNMLEKVTIPDSVTSIESGAFFNCKKLELKMLPDSITYIGNTAFQFCESLKLESLPNNLTEIETLAFCSCKNIRITSFPDSLEAIGAGAFMECPGLESIKLPSSIKLIGKQAFMSCPSLTKIEYDGNNLRNIGDSAFLVSSPEGIRTKLITKSSVLIGYGWKSDHRIIDVQNAYTVSFDANGGEEITATIPVFVNYKYGNLPVPTAREGYSFIGWFTKADGGEQVTSDTIVSVKENHTLYAKWNTINSDNSDDNKETCDSCVSKLEKIVELAFPSQEQRKFQFHYVCKVCGDKWFVYRDDCGGTYVDPIIERVPSADEFGLKLFTNNLTGDDIPFYVEFASVEIISTSESMAIGESKSIDVEILPNKVTKDKLVWHSSDTSVAEVDQNGKVTAISNGDVQISVVFSDENLNVNDFIWIHVGSSDSSVTGNNEQELSDNTESENQITENVIPNETSDLPTGSEDGSTEATTPLVETNNEEESNDKPCSIVIDSCGITYNVYTNPFQAKVVACKNKKSIKIPSTITINAVKFPVAELSSKSITGKNIQKITIDAKNLKKVDNNTFKGAKKLKKVIIKGVKKDSRIAKQIMKAAKKANKKVKMSVKK